MCVCVCVCVWGGVKGAHMFSESGGIQEVFGVELNDGGKVAERLVSNQIQLPSPRYYVMTDFVIFTVRERERGGGGNRTL